MFFTVIYFSQRPLKNSGGIRPLRNYIYFGTSYQIQIKCATVRKGRAIRAGGLWKGGAHEKREKNLGNQTANM